MLNKQLNTNTLTHIYIYKYWHIICEKVNIDIDANMVGQGSVLQIADQR